MKAEVVVHPGRPPKNNPRFVVTNLALTPAHVYQVYRARGDMENRIKELKLGLALDRTSCSRFQANAFRVLLTVAAYVLFQELRRRAARTACAGAQVWTLRDRLLKGRRLGAALGAPHRRASAAGLPLAGHVAAARLRRRRHGLIGVRAARSCSPPPTLSLRVPTRPCPLSAAATLQP